VLGERGQRAGGVLERAATYGVATAACAFAALATLTACPPAGLGPTCRFDGDQSTACGKCIAASCQSKIDDCCNEDMCVNYDLPRLDACAAKGSCRPIYDTSTYGRIFEGIRACVKASCAVECPDTGGGSSGSSGSSGREIACTLEAATESCTCVGAAAGGANETKCGPSDVAAPAAACCAGASWPSAGGCTCGAYRCIRITSSQCICGSYLTTGGKDETTFCSTVDKCCAKPGFCRCEGTPCRADETEVTGCDADSAAKTACGSNKLVTRCR
jgi:hypothetical protein